MSVSRAMADLQAEMTGRRRKVWHVSGTNARLSLRDVLNALEDGGHEIVTLYFDAVTASPVIVSWRWEITPAED